MTLPSARVLAAGQSPIAVARQVAARAAVHGADPRMRVAALRMLGGLPQVARDALGRNVPEALQRWARSTRHVREPGRWGEMLVLPWVTVETGAGDCDCIALAVCSAAVVVGLPCAVAVLELGRGNAHVAAVVGARGFYGGGPVELVCDPEARAVVSVHAEPWRRARVVPVLGASLDGRRPRASGAPSG